METSIHMAVKCLLMRPDTEKVAARIFIDDLHVTRQEDGYVIDLEGEEDDMIMAGYTAAEVLIDTVEGLCWYAHQFLTTGEQFPDYEGVRFEPVAPSAGASPSENDDYEYLYRLPKSEVVVA